MAYRPFDSLPRPGRRALPLLAAAGLALGSGMLPRAAEEGAAPPESAPLPRSELHVPVSIKAMMVSLIDPSAHRIWDLATRETLGDAQWQTIGHFATQLATAAPVLTLGGTGETDYEWVEAEEWTLYSRHMMQAAQQAGAAAQVQDAARLRSAADQLLDSCERCHEAFKPSLPHEQQHHPFYEYDYDPYTGRPA